MHSTRILHNVMMYTVCKKHWDVRASRVVDSSICRRLASDASCVKDSVAAMSSMACKACATMTLAELVGTR